MLLLARNEGFCVPEPSGFRPTLVGYAWAIILLNVTERRFSCRQRAVEMMVVDLAQNVFEARTWCEPHRDQIIAGNQTRQTYLPSSSCRHCAPAKMIETQCRAGCQCIEQ